MTKIILCATNNFEAIIKRNAYYVDKTHFIEKIENLGADYLFFLRPRRFGKSLFISTLEYYYDINHADKFDELFGNLYIGKNPTPLKNSYPILKLNLSAVVTHGTLEQIENSFNARIWSNLNSFFEKYASVFEIENIMDSQITPLKTASDMFSRATDYLYDKGVKFYLLIDEYDNFANNILADHGRNNYQQITHDTGFLRNFFTVIKAGTDSKTIDRMFATGVSPLLLSDVTSGFNMGDNISQDTMFNEMAGFTEDELKTLMDYYIEQKIIAEQDYGSILKTMKTHYYGYCFAPDVSRSIYNPNSVLYLLNQYTRADKMPMEVIDSNMKIDYQKFRFLIVESKKLNANFELLSDILQENSITSRLVRSFALSDLIEKDKFVSFLYYLGFLTIKKQKYTRFEFAIPNEICKQILWEYIRNSLKEVYKLDLGELEEHFHVMINRGQWEPLIIYIFEKFYQAASNHDFIYREEGVNGFILACLNMSQAYRVCSERKSNTGHADIYIAPNDMIYPSMYPRHILLELKYIEQSIITPNNRQKLIDLLTPKNHQKLIDLLTSNNRRKFINLYIKQAKNKFEQYAEYMYVPSNTIKIIALTTNEELLTLTTF